jgi:hypothetical protein
MNVSLQRVKGISYCSWERQKMFIFYNWLGPPSLLFNGY